MQEQKQYTLKIQLLEGDKIIDEGTVQINRPKDYESMIDFIETQFPDGQTLYTAEKLDLGGGLCLHRGKKIKWVKKVSKTGVEYMSGGKVKLENDSFVLD